MTHIQIVGSLPKSTNNSKLTNVSFLSFKNSHRFLVDWGYWNGLYRPIENSVEKLRENNTICFLKS